MAPRPAPLKQSDLTRYVVGAQKAGVVVGSILVRPDGTVEIILKGAGPTGFNGPDPDELLTR